MDRKDYDPVTGRPDLDPVTGHTDGGFGRRRSSSALWGLLIAAIVAIAAVMFMYNSGTGDRTATTNNPAATTGQSNVPPAGAPTPRDTTGSSAPTAPPTSPMAR